MAIRAEVTLSDELLAVRSRIHRGDLEGARAPLRELQALHPEAAAVTDLARLLAPPGVRAVVRAPLRSMAAEHDWLHAHAHEHPGCWLALLGDQLLAADRDLREVVETARKTPGGERALLHYEPAG